MKGPPRLSDPKSDAPDLLRLLVRAGQTDLPDAARMRALSAQLGPLAGGGAAGAAGGGGALAGGVAKGAGAAAAVKVGAGVMLAVAVGGGAVLGLQRAAPPTREVPVPSISVPIATPIALEASASASARESAVPTVLPLVVVASTRTPARPPNAATETAGISAPPSASAPVPSAESEIALLQAAQAALHGNPTSALVLADRHATRFPTGALAQEREVIAIEALVAMNRPEEASERGARFARDFPDSAHRPRIEALLRGSDHNP
jgi:hypothetical protein